jgi:hypothetical protein
MNGTNSQPNRMDTSQRINHVFGCQGTTLHITPGFKLLQSGDLTRCPECGADVFDATNTPVGQAYIAFGRIDLGEKPA